MGQLTRSSIVSQGLLLAGNTSLTSLANVWLNMWLKKQYDAWPWPFLQKRITGVALSTGATSISLGAGSGGVTPTIKRINDPIYLYNSDRSAAGRLRIQLLLGGSFLNDEAVLDPTKNRGTPTQAKIRADASLWGKWSIIPNPFPERDYLLAVDYIESPSAIDVTTAGDNVIPVYPSDETLVLCVEAYALKHQKSADVAMAFQNLAARAINDRVSYGSVEGINDNLGLDGAIFR